MVNVFQEEMKRLEANIDSLQHEKDQLHEKLVNAKSNPATAKWVIFGRFTGETVSNLTHWPLGDVVVISKV